MRYTMIMVGLLTVMAPLSIEAQVAFDVAGMAGRAIGRQYELGVGGSVAAMFGARIAVGGRYMRLLGDRSTLNPDMTFTDVENVGDVLAAELGIVLANPGVEVRAIANVGVVMFDRKVVLKSRAGNTLSETSQESTEFLLAPGLVATLPFFGFGLGAELHYVLVGNPGFGEDFGKNSFIIYFRLSKRFGLQ